MHRTTYDVPTRNTEPQGLFSPIEEPPRKISRLSYAVPSRTDNPPDEVPVGSPPNPTSSSPSASDQNSVGRGLLTNRTELTCAICQSLCRGYASLVAHHTRAHPNLPAPPPNCSCEYCHAPFQSHKSRAQHRRHCPLNPSMPAPRHRSTRRRSIMPAPEPPTSRTASDGADETLHHLLTECQAPTVTNARLELQRTIRENMWELLHSKVLLDYLQKIFGADVFG